MKDALIALSCATLLVVSPQQSRDATPVVPRGTAQISGSILNDDAAHSPLRRVTMTLAGELSRVRVGAVTDDNGRFAFTNLPADRYTLSAAKAGYLPWNYGSKRPGGSGTPIVVAESQRAAVSMTMVKGSVLSGIVRDGQGMPLPDVSVTALRYAVSSETGERELQAVKIGSSFSFPGYSPDAWAGTAMTDDRGVYRIYGLAPADYVVSASVRPRVAENPMVSSDIHQVSREEVLRAQQLLRGAGSVTSAAIGAGVADTSRVNYAPVYDPAAIAAADATIVTLGRSEEKSGIDVIVRLVPTATLTGAIVRPDGTPLAGGQVTLIEMGPSSIGYTGGAGRITRSNPDGTFLIAGVNPGHYLVKGTTYPEMLAGNTEIDIAGRDVSTSVVLLTGGTLSGQVVFTGAATPPPASSIIPMVRPFTGPKYDLKPDGRFAMSGIPAGKYRLLINGRPPVGWMLRSAMVNGVDAIDVPFEIKSNETIENAVITLIESKSAAEVSGRFLDAAGKPAPEYVLIVFSADQRFWMPQSRRTQVVRPDANGSFVARDLPPGDYFISVVTDLDDGEWNNPAYLAALAAASPVKVTLTEGEKKNQDIRIGGGQRYVQ